MYLFKKYFVCLLCISLFGIPLYAQETSFITNKAFIQLLEPLDTQNRLKNSTLASELPLTREDAAVIITTLLGYEGLAKDYKNSTLFTDVTTHKGEIHWVAERGIMTATNLFNPKEKVTKEQALLIIQRLQNKVNLQEEWRHTCYAIDSSSQMSLIPTYDAISFGWATLNEDKQTNTFNLDTAKAENDFKVPIGFEQPLDLAKTNGVETYLMIFFEDKEGSALRLLTDKEKSTLLINEIVKISQDLTKEGQTRAFDGITIDFENFISKDLQQPYTAFLKQLSLELKKINKKLNVAVPPNTYFKGYDYKGIGEAADKVILMAHDYAPKQLTALEQASGIVMTPITPINEIYKVLASITHPTTGVQDSHKIALQISYGSTQWQYKDGKVLHSKPYTPSYDKIYQRLEQSSTQTYYSEIYQNPYATYEQDGIKNIIWYENNKSVDAKKTLAKLFDIQNISYWRLGIIPIDYVE